MAGTEPVPPDAVVVVEPGRTLVVVDEDDEPVRVVEDPEEAVVEGPEGVVVVWAGAPVVDVGRLVGVSVVATMTRVGGVVRTSR